jgi:hypothetical protein
LLWKNKKLATLVVLLGLNAYSVVGYQEVFPMWARAKRSHGGLGWEQEWKSGVVLGTGGLGLLVFTLFLLGPITARLGKNRSMVVSHLIAAVVFGTC